MLSLISFFLLLQAILLLFMALHDWIHIPPLTDIRELEKHSTKSGRLLNSIIFFFLIFIPLLLTWIYRSHFSLLASSTIVLIYGILSLGTIFAWWVPYMWGSSDEHKAGFAEYRNTHHFLPKRGDNLIPNTFHVILHLQIWTCFVISLYLLLQHEGCFPQ